MWRGEAAGAPVLVHCRAGHQCDCCLLWRCMAVLLLMWRQHNDDEALAAAVAVRRAVERAAAANRGQRLQQCTRGASHGTAWQL